MSISTTSISSSSLCFLLFFSFTACRTCPSNSLELLLEFASYAPLVVRSNTFPPYTSNHTFFVPFFHPQPCNPYLLFELCHVCKVQLQNCLISISTCRKKNELGSFFFLSSYNEFFSLSSLSKFRVLAVLLFHCHHDSYVGYCPKFQCDL